MDYTQLFRSLREARGLTLEQLARLARVHRNTVVNIESGRQVRFATIAALMRKMGYDAASAELRAIALLWLESVSGIPFSQPETTAQAAGAVAAARAGAQRSATKLQALVARAQLSRAEADALGYILEHPELLSVVSTIRELAQDLAATEEPARLLHAAEDKAPYGRRQKRSRP